MTTTTTSAPIPTPAPSGHPRLALCLTGSS